MKQQTIRTRCLPSAMLMSTAVAALGCGGELDADRPFRPLPNPQSTAAPTPVQDADSKTTEDSLYLADEILQAVERTVQMSQQLSSARFFIKGLSASLIEAEGQKIPFVTFDAIDDADYYQVLRCQSASNLEAKGVDLRDLLSQALNLESWMDGLRSRDFWKALAQDKSCEVVHEALARNSFIDNHAPEGAFQYVVRACVLGSEKDSEAAASSPCSRLLALSQSVAARLSAQADSPSSIRLAVAAARSRLDEASIRLASATRDFARHMIRCEQEQRQENLARHRKDLLLAVLGLGARLGAEVLSAGGTNPWVGLRSVWQDHELLRREARPVVDVLHDVFETEADVLRQCAAAHEEANKARAFLAELSTHSGLLRKLAATLAGGAREVLK